MTRQVDGQRGDRRRRQPLLGRPALGAQSGERTDRRRAGQIDRTGGGQIADDAGQQRLVDEVAGQVGVAHRRSDGSESAGGVGQGDAGAGPAEVAQRDDAARSARRGRRCSAVSAAAGVGDQRAPDGSGTRAVRRAHHAARRRPRAPVRRIRHARPGPRRARCRAASTSSARSASASSSSAAVRRAVRRDDGHRVADPVDEVGDDQPALGEVRDSRWVRRPRRAGADSASAPPTASPRPCRPATAVSLVAPTESPIPSATSYELCPVQQSAADPGGHPARRQVVDGRHRVERAQAGRQATGRGGVAARTVGEPETPSPGRCSACPRCRRGRRRSRCPSASPGPRRRRCG